VTCDQCPLSLAGVARAVLHTVTECQGGCGRGVIFLPIAERRKTKLMPYMLTCPPNGPWTATSAWYDEFWTCPECDPAAYARLRLRPIILP
jgi:hypothetical protein